MPTPRLTPEIITAAIEGYEAQKVRIDAQIAELRSLLNNKATATSETAPRKHKKFSAAARKRMREAQRLRWAKVRDDSSSVPATPQSSEPNRRISEEGMKRIIAATKKRWAAVTMAKKAAGKKAAVKSAPAKVAKKRAPVKKAVVKTAPAPAQAVQSAAE